MSRNYVKRITLLRLCTDNMRIDKLKGNCYAVNVSIQC